MRNATFLGLVLLTSMPIANSLAARTDDEIQRALTARNELLKAIDTASHIGGNCKDKARTAINEMRHQDALNERSLGQANPQYWSHARYVYESSHRRLEQNKCAVKR